MVQKMAFSHSTILKRFSESMFPIPHNSTHFKLLQNHCPNMCQKNEKNLRYFAGPISLQPIFAFVYTSPVKSSCRCVVVLII